jgi:hypothetical protein
MTQKATQTQPAQPQPASKKPNDIGSISVEGFVRIFDPETKEVFVEKRA